MPYHKMPRVTGYEDEEDYSLEGLPTPGFGEVPPPPGMNPNWSGPERAVHEGTSSYLAGLPPPPNDAQMGGYGGMGHGNTPNFATDHGAQGGLAGGDLTGPMLGFMAANQIGSLLGNIFRRSPAPAAWSAPTLPAPAPTYANVKLLDRRHS